MAELQLLSQVFCLVTEAHVCVRATCPESLGYRPNETADSRSRDSVVANQETVITTRNDYTLYSTARLK